MFMLIKIEEKWVEYEVEKSESDWIFFKNGEGRGFVLNKILHKNHLKELKKKNPKKKKSK